MSDFYKTTLHQDLERWLQTGEVKSSITQDDGTHYEIEGNQSGFHIIPSFNPLAHDNNVGNEEA